MSVTSSLARTTPKALMIPRSRFWFSSVFLKTLRDFRVAILGWGIGLGAAIALVLVAYPFMLSTSEAKQAFVDSAKDLGFFWEPIAVSSPGGFAMFKLGPDLVFPAIWACSPAAVCCVTKKNVARWRPCSRCHARGSASPGNTWRRSASRCC